MVINKSDWDPITLPLIALRGLVVFPDNSVHFDVGRAKSIAAVGESVQHDQNIFLVTQKDVAVDDPTEKQDLYSVGVVARVCQVLRSQGDTLRIMVEGLYRAKLVKITQSEPYLTASLIRCPEPQITNTLKEHAYIRELHTHFRKYADLSSSLAHDLDIKLHAVESVGQLVDRLASELPLPVEDKQLILRTLPVSKRSETMLALFEREHAILSLEQTIQSRVQDQVEQNQKEYYLREQMKAITEELGEGENPIEEAEEYRRKIDACQLSASASEKLQKEVTKLSKMPTGSHEATVVRNYLDTVLELPWGIYSEDRNDLDQAARILDRDHYGMKDVKERILELMAVWKLTENRSSQVLCLVGPPGVGKTSVARSIAEATGREYVRVSLGGVRDESDIRGHRKTYIGAMMGRIMTAVKQAKTANPLILLDEIDKMGNDFKGDPSSALLEVLDSEQNHAFTDHYVEIPFDLSRVLFITTANDSSMIPRPLYDRMDVITLGSYTAEEKLHIAKKHLLKKQLTANGLNTKQLRLSDKQLRAIIAGYTREAGVRQLERLLAKICRQTAKRIIDGAESVSIKDLSEFLGPVKYKPDQDKHQNEIGVVNGLAWTSVGGEMLPIEVAILEGTGKIQLTGSLGDIMKESANLAISYVRSRANEWQLPKEFYRNCDIHLHAPEGAVPKDGPSAGAAMATAILSALSGTPVYGKIAMTGELSLRGKVLPIGGLKEKLMAAYTNGMKIVLIPKDNVSDLEKVDDVVKQHLTIIPVSHMDEVISSAFVSAVKTKPDFIPTKPIQQSNSTSTVPVV